MCLPGPISDVLTSRRTHFSFEIPALGRYRRPETPVALTSAAAAGKRRYFNLYRTFARKSRGISLNIIHYCWARQSPEKGRRADAPAFDVCTIKKKKRYVLCAPVIYNGRRSASGHCAGVCCRSLGRTAAEFHGANKNRRRRISISLFMEKRPDCFPRGRSKIKIFFFGLRFVLGTNQNGCPFLFRYGTSHMKRSRPNLT